MRNLLALLAAGTIAFAGVGWYLGWYQVTNETSLSGHEKVNIDVNGNKIMTDLKTGKKMVRELKHEAESIPVPAAQP